MSPSDIWLYVFSGKAFIFITSSLLHLDLTPQTFFFFFLVKLYILQVKETQNTKVTKNENFNIQKRCMCGYKQWWHLPKYPFDTCLEIVKREVFKFIFVSLLHWDFILHTILLFFFAKLGIFPLLLSQKSGLLYEIHTLNLIFGALPLSNGEC